VKNLVAISPNAISLI